MMSKRITTERKSEHQENPALAGSAADEEEAAVIGVAIGPTAAELAALRAADDLVAADLQVESTDELATKTTRGAAWTMASSVIIQGALLVQALIVPIFLTPNDYALWALVFVVAIIGLQLRDLSLGLKLVADRKRSPEEAFRIAFTLEVLLGIGGFIVIAAAAPVLAAVYHNRELFWLTLALAPASFGGVIALPQYVLTRDMRFAARAVRVSISTVIEIAAVIAAAAAGWGVWALVVSVHASLVMLLITLWPIARVRPGFVWDKAAFREYLDFGWPLWAASLCLAAFNFAVVNALTILFEATIVGYYQRVWTIISASWMINMQVIGALYPAVVRVGLQLDTLRRTFAVVNRLVQSVTAPIAMALIFFGPSLVLVWGKDWAGLGPYAQATAAFFLIGSLALDWENYYRVKGDTKPMFLIFLLLLAFLPVFLGLVIVLGEPGIWIAIVAVAVYLYVIRAYYARKLLGHVSALRAAWRQMALATVSFCVPWILLQLVGNPFASMAWPTNLVLMGVCGSAVGFVAYAAGILAVERRLGTFAWNAFRGRPTGGLHALLAD